MPVPFEGMLDVKITREKIGGLLEELRSWTPGEVRHSLHELARMFDLALFVVDRIARSEGFTLVPGVALEDDSVDPNATTQEIDVDVAREADSDD